MIDMETRAGLAWPRLPRGGRPLLLAAVLFAAAAAAVPAHAGYYVLTYASAQTGSSGVVYGYNASGSPSQLDTDGNIGLGSSTSVNCVSNSGQTCAYTATETNVDSTGTATVSANTASISVTTIPFFSYQTAQTFTAAASARADLSSGQLGVSGTGNFAGFDNGEDVGGSGTGWAALSDTLHLTVAGATASTVTTFGVTFTVDGGITILSGAPPDGGANGVVDTNLSFGNASVSTALNYTGYETPQETFLENAPSGWVSFTETPSGDGNFTFSGVYSVTGPTADIPVSASMFAIACQLEADCNFADTGQIGLSLPSDVSYTSDSGVFLADAGASDTQQNMPEPDSVIMMLAGLGLLALLRRVRGISRWTAG